MIFEVKTLLGRKTHCAIFEFFDGLPDMHVLIPKWVMEDLAIDEREPVRVRGVELDLVTSVKVQPHSVDFYSAVRDSKRDVKELLTESLSRFSTLTEDTAVPIEVNEQFFQVQVISVEPHGAVRIIDMDVQHHFEFKVEFEPAPELEDENARKEYQDRVLSSIKLRRERSAAGRQEIEQRRKEARKKRYEDLLQKFADGNGHEGEGQIEIALRMPDGSQIKGKFVEGAPASRLPSPSRCSRRMMLSARSFIVALSVSRRSKHQRRTMNSSPFSEMHLNGGLQCRKEHNPRWWPPCRCLSAMKPH
eukprot:symbB.v1.2.005008.t1/scaffold288.1/size478366/38